MKYSLTGGTLGSFLRPPGHPSFIFEFRDGARGSASVEYVAEQNFDLDAKKMARKLLDTAKLEMTEEWIQGVYAYYHSCYRGIDDKDIVIDSANTLPPERHCGFLIVKKYFPAELPRVDLILKK